MIDEIVKHLEHIPPKMLKKLLSGFVWEGTPDSGIIALTFDDGPDPEITPAVLDALNEVGDRGTFFMLGENVARYPDIAARVAENGHSIGNHSMTHRKLFLMKKDEVESEIDEAQKTIIEVTGTKPKYFRPPYGIFDFTSAHAVKSRGLSMVLWTVLSGDYDGNSPNRIMKTIEPFIRPGSIMVFHDTIKGGGKILPGIIKKIAAIARERAVRLGCIDELIISDDIEVDNSDSD